jgi:hypothetical protein
MQNVDDLGLLCTEFDLNADAWAAVGASIDVDAFPSGAKFSCSRSHPSKFSTPI